MTNSIHLNLNKQLTTTVYYQSVTSIQFSSVDWRIREKYHSWAEVLHSLVRDAENMTKPLKDEHLSIYPTSSQTFYVSPFCHLTYPVMKVNHNILHQKDVSADWRLFHTMGQWNVKFWCSVDVSPLATIHPADAEWDVDNLVQSPLGLHVVTQQKCSIYLHTR